MDVEGKKRAIFFVDTEAKFNLLYILKGIFGAIEGQRVWLFLSPIHPHNACQA